MVLNEVEMKNKIYIYKLINHSPNSAVVTRPGSGWVGPGSNPWFITKLIKITKSLKSSKLSI